MLATLAACSCLVISIRSCRTLHIITLITNLPSSCHESLTAIKFSNSWCIYFGLYINYWQQREPTIGKPHLGTPNANCSCIFAILSSSIHSLTRHRRSWTYLLRFSTKTDHKVRRCLQSGKCAAIFHCADAQQARKLLPVKILTNRNTFVGILTRSSFRRSKIVWKLLPLWKSVPASCFPAVKLLYCTASCNKINPH